MFIFQKFSPNKSLVLKLIKPSIYLTVTALKPLYFIVLSIKLYILAKKYGKNAYRK